MELDRDPPPALRAVRPAAKWYSAAADIANLRGLHPAQSPEDSGPNTPTAKRLRFRRCVPDIRLAARPRARDPERAGSLQPGPRFAVTPGRPAPIPAAAPLVRAVWDVHPHARAMPSAPGANPDRIGSARPCDCAGAGPCRPTEVGPTMELPMPLLLPRWRPELSPNRTTRWRRRLQSAQTWNAGTERPNRAPRVIDVRRGCVLPCLKSAGFENIGPAGEEFCSETQAGSDTPVFGSAEER